MAEINNENNGPTNNKVNSVAENSEGTNENEPKGTVDYAELIKTDKNLQAFLDSRITSSNKTAIENAKKQWQLEQDNEKSEAEKLASMNEKQKQEYEYNKLKAERDDYKATIDAYELRKQAETIANEKGVDISLLDFIDFKKIKADDLNTKIDSLSKVFKKAVENTVNDRLKEPTPKTPNTVNKEDAKKTELMKAMGLEVK